MNSPQRDYSLNRSRVDVDSHNMTIVDDLLSGLSDWRSVPDIVRLTFKAVLDILKSQGDTLKQLELEIPTKASKSELASLHVLKSAQNDLFRGLNEVKQSIECKISTEEFYSVLDEKVSKKELGYQLSSKAGYEEIRGIFCEKNEVRDLQAEVRSLQSDFSQFSEENYLKIQSTNTDIQDIVNAVNTKPSREEMLEALEEKANKQSVANALHRKANKVEVENFLSEKAEVTQFNQLSASMHQIQQDLTEKLNELNSSLEKMVSKVDYEESTSSLHSLRKEFENKSFSHFSSLEGFISSVKSDLEEFQSKHQEDIGKVTASINLKVNLSEYMDSRSTSKQELMEASTGVRVEFSRFQDHSNEKISKLEQCCKVIQDEILRVHSDIRLTNENLRGFYEKNKENIEDGLRSYQNFMANMLEESKRLQILIENTKKDLFDFDSKKIDKLEVKKLLDCKAEMRDLQEGVDRVFKDCGKIVGSRFEELRDLVNRKERELVLLIDAKPGVHEVNSLILDQSLGNLKKGYYQEAPDDRLLRTSDLRESYNTQFVEVYNIKNR